ncbi:MAG TPA: methyltransferase [Actinomycetales bacterium]|nr:methyltransferase [Actinomycetales bacterium]
MKRSDLAVAAQGLSLAGLLWPGRARWRFPRAVTAGASMLLAAGAALGVAGARAQGRHLTPHVEPPPDAPLLTTGPYRLSRNPVYSGLLAAAAGFAVLRRRVEPLVAFAALAATLHIKTGMEEQALRARFGAEYDTYSARTPRLLGLPR